MKKRLKLKKSVYIALIIFILLLVSTIYGVKKYKEYKYHQTYEYKLLQKGYTLDETNELQKLFKDKMLDKFLSMEKNSNIISIAKEKYYLEKNFDAYLKYKEENPNYNNKEIITLINTHRNTNYYENLKSTDLSKGDLILVNKYYALNEEYIPDDLINISSKYAWGENNSKQIREHVFNAYLEMQKDALENNIELMINSAHRTNEEQTIVYQKYKDKYGQEYADQYAARPGTSEHQTGLSLDIFSKDNTNTKTFKDSEAYYWLKDNSWKYGFILRYPEDKENITGYSFEAWHYRYVGMNAAKYIYENNITFDEYYAYFVEK